MASLRAALPGPWLILPTYNEAENIEPLVRAVLPQLASTGLEHTVLIVDDNSPDGTGEIADRLAEEIEHVRVLHRPHKQGLGRAYLAGFDVALAEGADLILEMDSDFSHDPADLPRLIAATGAADVVLGSRYVPGGGVQDWGIVRRALSRGGSAYARVLLGVPVRDLTGGFKCFHRRVLETIDLEGRSRRRLRLPDRADLQGGAGRLHGRRGADHVSRAARRALQDDRADSARGGLEGARAEAAAWRLSPSLYFLKRPLANHQQGATVAGNLDEVTDNNFQAEVLEADKPVLVDFWAPWCGPCRIIAPHLEELAGEREDLRIVKLNVDDNPQTAAQFNVMSIPMLLLFKHGQVAHQIIGALPKNRLVQELEPALEPAPEAS